jgi:hypothetical protein
MGHQPPSSGLSSHTNGLPPDDAGSGLEKQAQKLDMQKLRQLDRELHSMVWQAQLESQYQALEDLRLGYHG